MRTLLISLLLGLPLMAQGQGTLSSSGEEITLSLSGRVVQATSTLTLAEAPSAASFLLLVGDAASIPVSSLGLPGGVLGVDPAQGTLVALPWNAPSGSVSVSFQPPASLVGITTWVQAIALDPGLPAPGLALSDALPVTYGTARSTLVGLGTPGTLSLRRVAVDLSAVGPTSTPLDGIALLDVRPSATFDTATRPLGLAWRDPTDPARPRVVLPDGGNLHRYQRGSRQGLFITSPAADELRATFEVSAPIDSMVAASPFAPVVACVTAIPVAAEGGAILFLLRTDGANWPGRTTPWTSVVFTGALAGYDPEPSSLTFLDGALIVSDKVRVARIPLDGVTPIHVVPLPPSGGLIPIEVDEEFAWSADGSTVAFSAGQTDELRDVYALGVTGSAVNVTHLVAEYDDVSYDSISDGGLIALSPDGTRVACVRKLGADEDVIVEETGIAAAGLNITVPMLFGNSIESESGILFLSRDELLFTNGLEDDQKDVYRTLLPPTASGPISVSNVTGTSGLTSPPFSAGGTLELAGRGRLAGNGVLFDLVQGLGQPRTLVISSSAPGVAPLVQTGVASSPVTAASASASYIGITVGGAARLLRVDVSGVTTVLESFGIGTTIREVTWSPASSSLLVMIASGAQETPFIVADIGGSVPVTGTLPMTFLRGTTVMDDGSLLVRTASGGSVSLLRIDPATAAAISLGTAPGLTIL